MPFLEPLQDLPRPFEPLALPLRVLSEVVFGLMIALFLAAGHLALRPVPPVHRARATAAEVAVVGRPGCSGLPLRLPHRDPDHRRDRHRVDSVRHLHPDRPAGLGSRRDAPPRPVRRRPRAGGHCHLRDRDGGSARHLRGDRSDLGSVPGQGVRNRSRSRYCRVRAGTCTTAITTPTRGRQAALSAKACSAAGDRGPAAPHPHRPGAAGRAGEVPSDSTAGSDAPSRLARTWGARASSMRLVVRSEPPRLSRSCSAEYRSGCWPARVVPQY